MERSIFKTRAVAESVKTDIPHKIRGEDLAEHPSAQAAREARQAVLRMVAVAVAFVLVIMGEMQLFQRQEQAAATDC